MILLYQQKQHYPTVGYHHKQELFHKILVVMQSRDKTLEQYVFIQWKSRGNYQNLLRHYQFLKLSKYLYDCLIWHFIIIINLFWESVPFHWMVVLPCAGLPILSSLHDKQTQQINHHPTATVSRLSSDVESSPANLLQDDSFKNT